MKNKFNWMDNDKPLENEYHRLAKTINDHELDIDNIKCPICGKKMQVICREMPNEDDAMVRSWSREFENGGICERFGRTCYYYAWRCPDCGAKLESQVKELYWSRVIKNE